jgi:hypothetical protein
MHSHSRPGRANGGIKVDPTDSELSWRIRSHPLRLIYLDPLRSSDGQGGGERRPDRSYDLLLAQLRNFRLLRPDERPILFARKHTAVLIGYVELTALVLLMAGLLSNVKHVGKNATIFKITLFHHVEKVAAPGNNVILSIWLVFALLFLYLVYKFSAWFESYFVITERQMILVAGLYARRFASVPISKVTGWYVRESFVGHFLGYYSLVFKLGDDHQVVRTIGYLPGPAVGRIEEALSSAPREAADEEAFKKWTTGGPRRRVRFVIAVLLVFLLIVLGLAAATVPRIRAELSNETEIIALIPILIVLVTPKN